MAMAIGTATQERCRQGVRAGGCRAFRPDLSTAVTRMELEVRAPAAARSGSSR